MEHQTLGQQDVHPSDPAYYIEDCRIFGQAATEQLPEYPLINYLAIEVGVAVVGGVFPAGGGIKG